MQDQSHTPAAPAAQAPHDGPHSVTRLVHLSDIHLAPLPPFPWRHWNLKRALGYVNWRLKRRYVHTRDALDLITADISGREKDHILVGGDLCNIGLPLEYALGLRFLLELGSASEVAVVPGNHDIYTRLLTDPGVGRWQAFMTGDRAWDAFDAEQRLGPTFPYVRQIGQVAVIGVNTAVPTPPGSAYGRVGARQLTDLRRVLGRAGEQGLFRLILMHHPPRPDQALPSRGLRDGLQFMEVIAEFGAEAILHGHNHRPMQNTATTPGGTCPIYGVPSASVETAVSDWGLASYHALTITGDGPGSWKIVCARYSLAVDPDTDEPVVSLSETWSAEPGHAGLSDPVCAQS